MLTKKSSVVLILLLIFLSGCISGEVAVRKFTKPDFNKYPNLIIRHQNIKAYDFSEQNKVTYYYSQIGARIPFTIKEKNFYIEVKDVAFDKEGKEYATVSITTSKLNIYEYLYENKEIEVQLFDDKIKLTAESIIDHDNIEYLTIKGLNENLEPSIITPEPLEDTITQEKPIIVVPQHEEVPKNNLKYITWFFILLIAILLIMIIRTLFTKNSKF